MSRLIVRLAPLPTSVRSVLVIEEVSADNTEITVFISDAIPEDLRNATVTKELRIVRKKYHCMEAPIFKDDISGCTA